MTIATFLTNGVKKLEQAGIGMARLDALVLLEDVTGRDRSWLLANPDHKLSSSEISRLTKLINRRARHEPLAYVRKKTEFYGREFIITSAVLEPRPESETMIDLLQKLPGLPSSPCIADVGAGSGALGITVKLELPQSQVELLELDPGALEVARKNVDKYTIDVTAIESDLLASATQNNDILLCNLPYVPDDHAINEAASNEPKIAIFGGPDGLTLYTQLFNQVKKLQNQPLFILCESLPPQHTLLKHIALEAGYELIQTEDFIQVFKRTPK